MFVELISDPTVLAGVTILVLAFGNRVVSLVTGGVLLALGIIL